MRGKLLPTWAHSVCGWGSNVAGARSLMCFFDAGQLRNSWLCRVPGSSWAGVGWGGVYGKLGRFSLQGSACDFGVSTLRGIGCNLILKLWRSFLCMCELRAFCSVCLLLLFLGTCLECPLGSHQMPGTACPLEPRSPTGGGIGPKHCEGCFVLLDLL